MKITFSENRVTIEHQGMISTHSLGTLHYYCTDTRDGITFRKEDFTITAPVRSIQVDDIQMTVDNIEDLLNPLFVKP